MGRKRSKAVGFIYDLKVIARGAICISGLQLQHFFMKKIRRNGFYYDFVNEIL